MGAPDLLQHLRGAGFDLAVTADGGIKVTPASALADVDRLAIRANRAGLLALLAGADASDLAAQPAIEALGDDDRVTCAGGCGHYRPGLCFNHRKAGLASSALGRDLANLPQRCPGFTKGTP
jgi:hypothetical protein